MKQETLDNIKTNALAEKIKEAIQKGNLETKMSLFRMEATEIGLSDADVDNLVKEAHKTIEDNVQTMKFMEKHKTAFYIVLAVAIILVWVLPLGIGWKLVLSVLVISIVIFAISVLYVKKKRFNK